MELNPPSQRSTSEEVESGMASFAGALRVLNEMKSAGVVEDYAVAGAMALVFWSEPIPTFESRSVDADVLRTLLDRFGLQL